MANNNYEPSDVLISPREPYNKNTIWIHPKEDNIEIKIFDSGWKIISLTKDVGLSNKAKDLVEKTVEELKLAIISILQKLLGKFSSNNIILHNNLKLLEERITRLEDKLDRMNKKYSTLRRNGK